VCVCVCVCLCVCVCVYIYIYMYMAEMLKQTLHQQVRLLRVEYAERGNEYGILFIVSLLCEYIHLEYLRIHVMYTVNQAEYIIHNNVVAPQECVNTYSTRRVRLCSADGSTHTRADPFYFHVA